jgi:MoaA/NifB/PqqE/SkfB family radical SAM enzyme
MLDYTSQKLIIKSIALSTLPVFLGFLGGEPTIHPKFYELYEMSVKAVSKHKDGRLYITTNGSREIEFFEKIKYHDNVYFLWSFHPEYLANYAKGDSKYGVILDNIKLMQERGFKNKVNIMLSDDEQYWDDLLAFSDELEKIEGVELHPHFLYTDSKDKSEIFPYTDAFYKKFEKFKYYNKEFLYDGKEYNDYEMFTLGLNKFKGWSCYNNNYEIRWDGTVEQFCFNEETNLLKDLFFFRKLKEVTGKPCPYNVCECDGLLKIYKEKT